MTRLCSLPQSRLWDSGNQYSLRPVEPRMSESLFKNSFSATLLTSLSSKCKRTQSCKSYSTPLQNCLPTWSSQKTEFELLHLPQATIANMHKSSRPYILMLSTGLHPSWCQIRRKLQPTQLPMNPPPISPRTHNFKYAHLCNCSKVFIIET